MKRLQNIVQERLKVTALTFMVCAKIVNLYINGKFIFIIILKSFIYRRKKKWQNLYVQYVDMFMKEMKH